MSNHNLLNKAAYWPTVFLAILTLGSASAIVAHQPPGIAYTRPAESASQDEMAKIISYLETRTSERKVLDKAAAKLFTLDRKRIHLIASLCERFSGDGETASSSIAFSLVSAMIVLS